MDQDWKTLIEQLSLILNNEDPDIVLVLYQSLIDLGKTKYRFLAALEQYQEILQTTVNKQLTKWSVPANDIQLTQERIATERMQQHDQLDRLNKLHKWIAHTFSLKIFGHSHYGLTYPDIWDMTLPTL